MIALSVLGALELVRRDAHDTVATPIPVRRKQAAVLARLVLHEPRGWLLRGPLLAMFWPESDERRARFSLRNVLHGLRSELGNDAILTRADDAVMANPDLLSCDALTFEDLIAAGQLDDALALYRGPLLGGFIVGGAPDFDMWIDQRREGLTRRAVSAAVILAERADAAGDETAAIGWNRRALELSPHDETHVRRLLHRLDARGDRAGALLLYEQWTTRLRSDLESDPSPQTRALAESLRAAPTTRVRHIPATAPQPVAAGVPLEISESRLVALEPASSAPAHLHPHSRSRTWRTAIGAIATAILVVGTIATLGMRRDPTTPEKLDGTAVFPFSSPSDPQLASIAQRTAALVSSGFGETGPMHGIDPRVARTVGDAGISPRSAVARQAEAARALGANCFVVGSVSGDRGIVQLEASIYDLTRDVPLGHATSAGPIDSIAVVAQRLAFDLIAARTGGPSVASLGRPSANALLAYFDGERQMFAARYAGAVDGYSRAIAADSQFARAYLQLARAASMGGFDRLVDSAASRAVTLSSRLVPIDRQLLDAWRHARAHEIPESIFLYEDALRADDRNLDAWLQLAEIRFHWGPTLGIPASSAADAFRRAAAIAPSNAAALIHLARIEARDAPRGGGFDSLARAARALDLTATEDLELRLLGAILSGNTRERAAVIADAVARGGPTERQMLAAASQFPDTVVATALARNLAAGSRQDLHIAAAFQLAQIAAAHGRLRDARDVARRLAAFAPERALELHASILLLPYETPAPREARAVADSIATLIAAGTLDFTSSETALSILAPRAHYLEGALALAVGDTNRTLASASTLARWPSGLMRVAAVASAAALREELAMRRNPTTAIAAFDAPRISASTTYPDFSAFPTLRERFLRAESLRAAGRTNEALAWYESFPDPMGSDVWFLPAALQRRAALYTAAGRSDAARLARERLAAFWRNADVELDKVVAAKEHVAR